ncbi:hypothetical protein ACIODS_27320 [Micromonospora chalcea]|uniref:hypothetical protein n=1 Tax=Micromonospora chalcea TaxID=1874 RepID=UPI0038041A99
MTLQPISQMPGTSLDELEQISNGMQEFMRAASAEARETALEAMKGSGVFQRLFPSRYQKETQELAVQTLRQFGAAKREFIEVFTRTQLEIARKRADALIATQGMHLQTQLARFAAERIQDLNETINAALERFMSQMAPQFDMIERFQNRPELYEPARRSLNHQIKVYFDSTSALLNGFNESLHKKVGSAQ